MSTKLKSCPFCGSEEIMIAKLRTYHYVYCEHCHTSTHEMSLDKDVVERWNTRVGDDNKCNWSLT